MKTTIRICCATIVVTSLSLACLTGQAAPLYQETFDNTTGANQGVNFETGWQAYRGSTATNISSNASAAAAGYTAIASAAGNPTPPIGFLFANRGTDAGGQTFGIVDTFSTGISLEDGYDISFTMGNTTSSAGVRLLIQVGGDGTAGSGTWYASTALFQDAGGFTAASYAAAPTASVTYNLDFTSAAASWRSFTLAPDSSMAIGATLGADLSSSTITGIGFYVNPGFSQQTVRLDNLTVVPEPHTAGLLLTALIGTLNGRRRRFGDRN